MSDIYSISLEGIRFAEQNFEHAARNIAEGRSVAHSAQTPASSDSVILSFADPVTGPSAGAGVDYAGEMVTIIEARIGFHGNLRATASQQQLDRSALDLLA